MNKSNLTELDPVSSDRIEGPFGHDYTALAKHLSGLSGRVVFIPNVGNAGDCIICTGSFNLFQRIGLDPEIGDWREIYPDAHVIYPGGGNMVPYYQQGWNCLKAHIGHCLSFTLMPHTVRGGEDILPRLDKRFTLFAREPKTFRHLEEHATGATIALSHDMAFANEFRAFDHLGEDVPKFHRAAFGSSTWRHQSKSQVYWYARRSRSRWRGAKLPSGSSLDAFRTDSERAGVIPVPRGNVDLSDHLAFPRDPLPFMSFQIAKAFISILDRYDTVRTDRLHVALTAALLGKKVEAWDNSYGKLSDVLGHSLPDHTNIHLTAEKCGRSESEILFKETSS